MSQGVGFVFPGQGSQSIGMLNPYFSKEKKFNYVFDKSKEILGVDFKDLLLKGTAEDLSPTEITQPLMLTANNAIWECLAIEPKEVTVMAGHSLGEYSALVSAKSLTFEDALILVSSRAKFMQEAVPEGEGAIAAIIGLTYEDLDSICLSICNEGLLVELANINSSNQIVISGAKKAVEKAIERSIEAGAKRAVLLPMSVPAHCDLMKPASDSLLKTLNQLNLADSMMPIYQNINALPENRKEVLRENLTQQIVSSVQWQNTIENMIKNNIGSFIELGPKKILTNLIKKSYPDIVCESFEDFTIHE